MISDLTELVDQPGPIRLEIRSGQGVLVLDFDNERNRIYDFLIRKFIQRVEGRARKERQTLLVSTSILTT